MKLLVLDIDETLVHATTSPLTVPHHLKIGDYYIYERPNLDSFLFQASEVFDIALWSSSSEMYVSRIANYLKAKGLELKFSWSVERCKQKPSLTTGGYVYLKDLRKLRKFGYDMDNIAIIDDTPEKLRQTKERLVTIDEFLGAPEDDALLPALQRAKELVRA